MKTFLDDQEHLVFTVNTRQLSGQTRMAAEFAAQLHSEPLAAFCDRTGGANRHAFATIQATVHVDPGHFILAVESDRIFFTGVNTCFAQGAGFIGQPRRAGADDADVFYLGLGAGIGAVR